MTSDPFKRCSNCILPSTYPNISFDSNGLCSICRSGKPANNPIGEQSLIDAVSEYRATSNKYDCIVAFSGGRDSTYILWHAIRKLGLKVLALFTDNGYAPEHTHENIKNTVKILETDLHIEKYNDVIRTFPGMLKAWIEKPSVATVSLLCTGCSYGRRLLLPSISKRFGIPLMLVGGGEPELSFAEMLLNSNSSNPTRFELLKGFAREIANNPRLLSPKRALTLFREFGMRYMENSILRIKNIQYPKKKIFPYYYIGWNEKTIMDTITSRLNWKKGNMCGTAWRSDCLIAPLKNYIYGRILGFHKVDELLSGMVRIGQINRDEALKRLPEESRISRRYLENFLQENGTSLNELNDAISRVSKQHRET